MASQLYKITGMNCGSCVSRVEKAMKAVKGVAKAQVNLADHSAVVEGAYNAKHLCQAVAKAGYTATPMAEVDAHNHLHTHENPHHAAILFIKAIPAAVLGLFMMVYMHTHPMPIAPYGLGWQLLNWLVLLVMIGSGGHIYLAAFKSIKVLQPNMYTLIGLGTAMAWGYSCLVLYAPSLIAPEAEFFYYEAALFILAFINIGQGLEVYAKGRASNAVAKLLALTPDYVQRIRQGVEETTPLSEIIEGDLIKIRPGESIPVDGVVEEGQTAVSEAMLTGEPLMVAKGVGSKVVAGTQNGQGSIIMRAQEVGQNTVLAKVVGMVRQAQATKPPIAELVDKIAGVFAFIVIVLAAVAAVIWYYYGPVPQFPYAFTVAMTMLVVACPCALGLATPISIMVGVSRAARGGVLMPRGNALQQLGLADIIAFDKTGTLTMGAPQVVQIIAADGQTIDRVLQIAASLANLSEHPLSSAIVHEAHQRNTAFLKATVFQSITGQGIKAKIGGVWCSLGNAKFMQANALDTTDLESQATLMLEQGKTVVYIARDKALVGVMALSDSLRPEAKKAVAELHKIGKEVVMLTGDNPRAAKHMAQLLGIDKVFAGLSPEEKLNHIKNYQSQGKLVAMVGDGINDAPALAQANIGISLATGSDIAVTTADVIIATNNLLRLPFAIRVSRGTMRNIKQNLFWAFLYNSAALPVAAGVLFPITGQLLPPWAAGAAMAASSLTVVLNALRLNLIKN